MSINIPQEKIDKLRKLKRAFEDYREKEIEPELDRFLDSSSEDGLEVHERLKILKELENYIDDNRMHDLVSYFSFESRARARHIRKQNNIPDPSDDLL